MEAISKGRNIARYALCIALFASYIALGATLFSGAYVDLWATLKTSWYRLGYYFNELLGLGIDMTPPTVIPPPPIGGGGGSVILPENPSYIITRLKIFGLMLINVDSYMISGQALLSILFRVLQISMIVVPILIILIVIVRKLYFSVNTRHGHDTAPLRAHKMLSRLLYTPIINITRDTHDLISNSMLKKILIILWLFNFNIVTIVINVISFYLYFVVSFHFIDLYNELVFIVNSLKYVAIGGAPIIVLITLYLINKLRLHHAIRRLESLESKNKETLSKRDISTYKWGAMGTNKTKTLTDQALSLSVMDTEKAFEQKRTCRKMFPFFPWLLFELDIEKRIIGGELYNWAVCVEFVDKMECEFKNNSNDLYGYNVKKYGTNYNNGIVDNELFHVLRDYIRLHMIYIQYNSFIISNYPIREDKVMHTEGNSVVWDNSFFNFNKSASDSKFSKILNFDLLRMCKTFNDVASNKSLEYGIICIAEDDKEQTNAVQTLNDSTDSPYPNPKNDGINKTEKFIRHRATVMGYCYAHILKDGQRVMSINADTRELATLEHMQRPKGEKMALPFFWFDKLLYKPFGLFFDKFEEKITYYRGDNTLLMYILTSINRLLYNNYYRKYNRYSYTPIEIECQDGTQDSEKECVKYYLMNAKIYANRYNTATHEQFFYEMSKTSGTGIIHYPSYKGSTMSDNEFDEQNSYSRKEMVNPDWKKPYIESEQKRKDLLKAESKANAKAIIKSNEEK